GEFGAVRFSRHSDGRAPVARSAQRRRAARVWNRRDHAEGGGGGCGHGAGELRGVVGGGAGGACEFGGRAGGSAGGAGGGGRGVVYRVGVGYALPGGGAGAEQNTGAAGALMPVSGTLLNVLTVLVGGSIGLLVGGRLPERLQSTIMGGLGLATMLIGIQNGLTTQNPLILLGSILLGGIVGELLRLDFRLDSLGAYLQKRLARSGRGASTFSEAFVTSSLVFCVGPLTVLGSILNGVNGDIKLLAIKSLLDGFAAFAFAATLGWGVLMSAVTVLVFQGALSLAAFAMASGMPSR